MAISGVIEFHASSGAPSHPYQLDPFVAGSGLNWNRIAFLGAAGEGSYLLLNYYQDKTYACDETGAVVDSGYNAGEGELQNLKYIDGTNCDPNASGTTLLSAMTEQDASLMVHFAHPSGWACTMSNTRFRCVTFGAASGIADETAVEPNVVLWAFEVGRDTAWTKITDDAANNYIDLDARAIASVVHDYHIGVTASPNTTGQKVDFGFFFETEFV